MSNLPQLVVVGIAAVVALCFVHGRIDTVLPRAKFVVLALWGVGRGFGAIAATTHIQIGICCT